MHYKNFRVNRQEKQIKLLRNILKGHEKMGEKSPLNDELIEKIKEVYQQAKELTDLQESLKRKAEQTTDRRNRIMGNAPYTNNPDTVNKLLISSKYALLSAFITDPRALSDYGFEIDNSKRSTKSDDDEDSIDLLIDDELDNDNSETDSDGDRSALAS